jgi:hypothetical protein
MFMIFGTGSSTVRLTGIPTREVGDEGDPDGSVVNFVNWDGPYNIEDCR